MLFFTKHILKTDQDRFIFMITFFIVILSFPNNEDHLSWEPRSLLLSWARFCLVLVGTRNRIEFDLTSRIKLKMNISNQENRLCRFQKMSNLKDIVYFQVLYGPDIPWWSNPRTITCFVWICLLPVQDYTSCPESMRKCLSSFLCRGQAQ